MFILLLNKYFSDIVCPTRGADYDFFRVSIIETYGDSAYITIDPPPPSWFYVPDLDRYPIDHLFDKPLTLP